MVSADFSRQILFQPWFVTKTSHIRKTSPGTHTFFPSMSPPSLLCRIPYSYWALTCVAALPSVFSLKWFLYVGAEVCLHLPSALLNLTARTLVFSYILPTAGRIRDFHPLERTPAGRTTKRLPGYWKPLKGNSVGHAFTGLAGPRATTSVRGLRMEFHHNQAHT